MTASLTGADVPAVYQGAPVLVFAHAQNDGTEAIDVRFEAQIGGLAGWADARLEPTSTQGVQIHLGELAAGSHDGVVTMHGPDGAQPMTVRADVHAVTMQGPPAPPEASISQILVEKRDRDSGGQTLAPEGHGLLAWEPAMIHVRVTTAESIASGATVTAHLSDGQQWESDWFEVGAAGDYWVSFETVELGPGTFDLTAGLRVEVEGQWQVVTSASQQVFVNPRPGSPGTDTTDPDDLVEISFLLSLQDQNGNELPGEFSVSVTFDGHGPNSSGPAALSSPGIYEGSAIVPRSGGFLVVDAVFGGTGRGALHSQAQFTITNDRRLNFAGKVERLVRTYHKSSASAATIEHLQETAAESDAVIFKVTQTGSRTQGSETSREEGEEWEVHFSGSDLQVVQTNTPGK